MINKRVVVFIMCILFFLILLIPSLFYIYKFKSLQLSDSTADWGTFGDFFGGVTNTIISLMSLIILAYISWMVSKLTAKENKHLLIFEKRNEAFNELMRYIPKINVTPRVLRNKIRVLEKVCEAARNVKNIDQIEFLESKIISKTEEIYEKILIFHEYHHFLFNYKARYNHLFEYNFDCIEYKKLISTSSEFCERIDESFKNIESERTIELSIQELFDLHMTYLAKFINSIKEELE